MSDPKPVPISKYVGLNALCYLLFSLVNVFLAWSLAATTNGKSTILVFLTLFVIGAFVAPVYVAGSRFAKDHGRLWNTKERALLILGMLFTTVPIDLCVVVALPAPTAVVFPNVHATIGDLAGIRVILLFMILGPMATPIFSKSVGSQGSTSRAGTSARELNDDRKEVKQTRNILRPMAARVSDRIVGPRRSSFRTGPSDRGMKDNLREIKQVRQNPGEPLRRWFTSNEFDLYVWCDDSGKITAFQLCYDKAHSERAFTWKRGVGSSHHAVDDGEGRAFRHKASPIFVADGHFNSQGVADRLAEAGGQLPREILELVLNRLRQPNETNGDKPFGLSSDE